MIEISEGRTNNYLIHGIAAIVCGVIVLYLSSIIADILVLLAFVIFIVAISLFLAKNGLEIDVSKNKFRRFGKVLTLKFGAWKTLLEFDRIELRMQSSNAQKNVMMGIVPGLNSKSLTYDIVIFDSFDDDQIVYDFLDYYDAKKALKIITDEFDVSSKNRVAEKMAKNKAKRRR